LEDKDLIFDLCKGLRKAQSFNEKEVFPRLDSWNDTSIESEYKVNVIAEDTKEIPCLPQTLQKS